VDARQDDPARSRVRLPETSKGRGKLAGNASGWGEALTLLRFWVEHRLGHPRGVAGAGAAAERDEGSLG